MASNVAGLIREGVAAFKAGRKEEAQKLLAKATQLDERNEEAWLWLSAVVDSVDNQRICLENVLAINPGNPRAQQGLEAINKQFQQQAPKSQESSPFDMSMPAPATVDPDSPPPSPSPPADPQPSAPAFLGSGKDVNVPSETELDNWVDGLNLGGNAGEPKTSSDPFGFSSGPFGQKTDSSPFADAFGVQSTPSPPASPPPAFDDMTSPGQEPSDFGESDSDTFPDLRAQAEAFAQEDTSQESFYETELAYDTESSSGAFDTHQDDETGYYDENAEFSSASPFGAFDEQEVDYEQADDLLAYFGYLPDDIKATHLPGVGPARPRGLTFGLTFVSLGTVAALVVLVMLAVQLLL